MCQLVVHALEPVQPLNLLLVLLVLQLEFGLLRLRLPALIALRLAGLLRARCCFQGYLAHLCGVFRD